MAGIFARCRREINFKNFLFLFTLSYMLFSMYVSFYTTNLNARRQGGQMSGFHFYDMKWGAAASVRKKHPLAASRVCTHSERLTHLRKYCFADGYSTAMRYADDTHNNDSFQSTIVSVNEFMTS